VKRRSGQRSALERRVWQLIDDIREALRLGRGEWPLTAADSTGRRNGLMKSLSWCFVV